MKSIYKLGGREVEIVNHGRGQWQWHDLSDRYAYSDFISTRAEAVKRAKEYLRERAKNPQAYM